MQDLPLVKLKLASPLLTALEEITPTGEITPTLSGFTPEAIHHSEVLVTAPVMYSLVEEICKASGDPYFGVRVSEKMELAAWPPLHDAVTQSGSLGDALMKFILDANEHASSVTYSLTVGGERTTFRERRQTSGGITPSHNDGFTIAYLLKIIKVTVGENWFGKDVLVKVCSPAAVPSNYLGIRIASTDRMGPSINFPSRWLLTKVKLDKSTSPTMPPNNASPASDFPRAVHQALEPLLANQQLDARQVAGLFGMSSRTLARRLQSYGTTLGKELARLRIEKAQNLLCEPEIPVAEIGRRVGYQDAAVFARTFRRWVGKSPSEFRRLALKGVLAN